MCVCRVLAVAFAALMACMAMAQPTLTNLGYDFQPLKVSANGKVVVGIFNTEFAAYDVVGQSPVELPAGYPSDAVGCSADGSLIVGNDNERGVYWKNGVEYDAGMRGVVSVTDDGKYISGYDGAYVGSTITLKRIGPDGTKAYTFTCDSTHGDAQLECVSGDGSIFYFHGNGQIHKWVVGENSSTTLTAPESYGMGTDLHGAHLYGWAWNVSNWWDFVGGKILYTGDGTGDDSFVAEDNCIAGTSRTVYMPGSNTLMSLVQFLTLAGLPSTENSTVRGFSADGLTMIGEEAIYGNSYWVATLALIAASDHYSAVPNKTLVVPAPGVKENDFSLDAPAVLVAPTTHGTVHLRQDGSFSYLPTVGYLGPDVFTYRISKGAKASAVVAVKIRVGVVQSLSVTPASVLGGSPSKGIVKLNFTPSAPVEVALKSSKTALATVPPSVTIPAGSTTATFPIDTKLYATTGASTISATYDTQSSTATLVVGEYGVKSLTFNPPLVPAGNPSTATLTLWRPAGSKGMPVTLAAGGSATVPAGLTVPAGESTSSFQITTAAVLSTQNVTITALANGYAFTAPFTIRVPVLTGISFNPSPVVSGNLVKMSLHLDGIPGTQRTFTVNGQTVYPGYVDTQDSVIELYYDGPDHAITQAITVTGPDIGTIKSSIVINPASLISLTAFPPKFIGGNHTTLTPHFDGDADTSKKIEYVSSMPAVIPSVDGYPTKVVVTSKPVAADTPVTYSFTYRGATKTTVVHVLPPALAGVVCNSPIKGGASGSGSVILSGITAPSGMTVLLSTSDANVLTMPTTCLVPGGTDAVSFTFKTKPVTAATAVIVTATLNGLKQTATVNVTP